MNYSKRGFERISLQIVFHMRLKKIPRKSAEDRILFMFESVLILIGQTPTIIFRFPKNRKEIPIATELYNSL